MKKNSFVIMPFGKSETEKSVSKAIFAKIASVAAKKGLLCRRADDVLKPGNVIKEVVRDCHSADIVIADLTDQNPNVFYELGVRHSLRAGTILITQKVESVPFDLRGSRLIQYGTSFVDMDAFLNDLEQALDQLLQQDPPEPDSPVLELISRFDADRGALQERVESLCADLERERYRNDALMASQDSLAERVSALQKSLDGLTAEQRNAVLAAAKDTYYEELRASAPKHATRRSVDPKSVFVLMPFRGEFDDVYLVIKDALESCNLAAFRADEIAKPGRITDQIMEAISGSRLVIADLTGNNPNVLWELGYAQALGVPTLIINQNVEESPFDVAEVRQIVYDRGRLTADLRPRLRAAVQAIVFPNATESS